MHYLYYHDLKRPLVKDGETFERAKGPIARALRVFSKSDLVEYISRTHTGFPVYVNFDLLRAIMGANKARELMKVIKMAQPIRAYLDKHVAVHKEDGGLLRFDAWGKPGRTRAQVRRLIRAWNQYCRLASRSNKLQAWIGAIERLDSKAKEPPK